MSVSEKGAGLSGPLVEDHYELELPWLPWLRADPGAESARGNPDAKRSPKYRAHLTLQPILYTPDCYAYATLPFFLLLLLFLLLMALRSQRSALGFRSRIPLLCVPFLFPFASDSSWITVALVFSQLYKSAKCVGRSSYDLTQTLKFPHSKSLFCLKCYFQFKLRRLSRLLSNFKITD